MTDARTNSEAPPPRAIEAHGLSTIAQEGSPPFEPNRWLRWLYGRFFRHIQLDETWSAAVRESAARGVVVYVMRSISVLDFLCLDYLLKRFRLPMVRFVNDLGLWILEPFGRGERRLRLRRQIPEQEALAKVLHDYQSALLFLRRPPHLGEPRTGQGLKVDLIRALVEQQRKLDRPILLVPQSFLWTKRPPNKRPSALDLIFGPAQWPGRIRVFLRFLFNHRNAQLRTGQPFDVAAFLDEHQHLTDAEAADRIRYALLRRIERERRVLVGPAKKSPGRIRDEILRSPRVFAQVKQAATKQKRPVETVLRQADAELRRLAALMNPFAIRLFQRVLQWVWTRIYDGWEVDKEGLARAREAAVRGPLILLPSHKSHVDYLVVSDVLERHGVAPPLIAAGENLSFFPLGWLLRRCGAFFIRRSFRGRKLYAALVSAYLRKVLNEGFNVEFFMEGGRSRTGKLLPPKLGLLSMVVDAGLMLPSVDLQFVPVSIGYERIIEARSYSRELGGAEKEPESVGGLLKTSKVLRSRYGRLYVQFGEIFGMRDLLNEAAQLHGDAERDPRKLKASERRALINRIAHRVTYEIDRATIVTPAGLIASALMSFGPRAVSHDDLLERCAFLLAALRRSGARIAASIIRQDPSLLPPPARETTSAVAREMLRDDTVEQALLLFSDAKLIETEEREGVRTHEVPVSRRLSLEYHKNTTLHFFVPSALISAALSVAKEDWLAEPTLRERVSNLSRLFKYEFMYRADATFDEIFTDALEGMVEAGDVERSEAGLRPGVGTPVYTELLVPYFEGYRLAVRALDLLGSTPVRKKDWLKQALQRGEKMAASGRILHTEAVSRQKLIHALSVLHDEKLAVVRSEEIRAGEAMADQEAVGSFESRIAKYIPK